MFKKSKENPKEFILRGAAKAGVMALFELMGEDPQREGLLATPDRVLKAFHEMTQGYQQDPASILSTDFDGEDYDQMIVLRDIQFESLCEHHLLPFIGKATVGYIPKNRIVG